MCRSCCLDAGAASTGDDFDASRHRSSSSSCALSESLSWFAKARREASGRCADLRTDLGCLMMPSHEFVSYGCCISVGGTATTQCTEVGMYLFHHGQFALRGDQVMVGALECNLVVLNEEAVTSMEANAWQLHQTRSSCACSQIDACTAFLYVVHGTSSRECAPADHECAPAVHRIRYIDTLPHSRGYIPACFEMSTDT